MKIKLGTKTAIGIIQSVSRTKVVIDDLNGGAFSVRRADVVGEMNVYDARSANEGDVYVCADCGKKFTDGNKRDDHFMSSDCPKNHPIHPMF